MERSQSELNVNTLLLDRDAKHAFDASVLVLNGVQSRQSNSARS